MHRTFRLALITTAVFGGLALVPLPGPLTLTGAAVAQVQPSGISMLNPLTIIRMGKSRTEGPGMKVLERDAEAFCVDCHRGHDRNRKAAATKRTRSAPKTAKHTDPKSSEVTAADPATTASTSSAAAPPAAAPAPAATASAPASPAAATAAAPAATASFDH